MPNPSLHHGWRKPLGTVAYIWSIAVQPGRLASVHVREGARVVQSDHGFKPLVVVAAVIEHEGRILACRRNPDRAAGGKWEFPGGKVEPGELPEEALIREIREELAVEILVAERISTDDTWTDGRIIRLECFRASLVSAAPSHSMDHDRLGWFSPPELTALDWAEPDRPAVNLLTGL